MAGREPVERRQRPSRILKERELGPATHMLKQAFVQVYLGDRSIFPSDSTRPYSGDEIQTQYKILQQENLVPSDENLNYMAIRVYRIGRNQEERMRQAELEVIYEQLTIRRSDPSPWLQGIETFIPYGASGEKRERGMLQVIDALETEMVSRYATERLMNSAPAIFRTDYFNEHGRLYQSGIRLAYERPENTQQQRENNRKVLERQLLLIGRFLYLQYVQAESQLVHASRKIKAREAVQVARDRLINWGTMMNRTLFANREDALSDQFVGIQRSQGEVFIAPLVRTAIQQAAQEVAQQYNIPPEENIDEIIAWVNLQTWGTQQGAEQFLTNFQGSPVVRDILARSLEILSQQEAPQIDLVRNALHARQLLFRLGITPDMLAQYYHAGSIDHIINALNIAANDPGRTQKLIEQLHAMGIEVYYAPTSHPDLDYWPDIIGTAVEAENVRMWRRIEADEEGQEELQEVSIDHVTPVLELVQQQFPWLLLDQPYQDLVFPEGIAGATRAGHIGWFDRQGQMRKVILINPNYHVKKNAVTSLLRNLIFTAINEANRVHYFGNQIYDLQPGMIDAFVQIAYDAGLQLRELGEENVRENPFEGVNNKFRSYLLAMQMKILQMATDERYQDAQNLSDDMIRGAINELNQRGNDFLRQGLHIYGGPLVLSRAIQLVDPMYPFSFTQRHLEIGPTEQTVLQAFLIREYGNQWMREVDARYLFLWAMVEGCKDPGIINNERAIIHAAHDIDKIKARFRRWRIKMEP